MTTSKVLSQLHVFEITFPIVVGKITVVTTTTTNLQIIIDLVSLIQAVYTLCVNSTFNYIESFLFLFYFEGLI